MDPLAFNQSSRTAKHLWMRYRPWVAVIVVCALVLGVGAVAYRSWSNSSPDIDLVSDSAAMPQLPGAQPPSEGGAGSQESSAQIIVVHVAGQVESPGIVSVPEGARADDAVRAAGGFTKSAARDAINLAALVVDGEQIYVPSRDEASGGGFAPPGGGASAGSGGGAGGQGQGSALVDVNTATAEQLETLPGVGPVTASKIVADRTANGRYGSLQDLTRVSGIGEKRVEAMEGLAVAR